MRCPRFVSVAATTSLLVITGVQGRPQQAGSVDPRAGTAQGQLTVTATVMSSVGVVTGPDGKARVIVANAADPAYSVSSIVTPVPVPLAEDRWRIVMRAFEPFGGVLPDAKCQLESNVTVRPK